MLYRNVQCAPVIMLIATGTVSCKAPEDVLAAEIALSIQLMQEVQKKGQQFAQERQKEAATIVHCLTSLQQTTHDTLLDDALVVCQRYQNNKDEPDDLLDDYHQCVYFLQEVHQKYFKIGLQKKSEITPS